VRKEFERLKNDICVLIYGVKDETQKYNKASRSSWDAKLLKNCKTCALLISVFRGRFGMLIFDVGYEQARCRDKWE
jgi:hypothetical protein